MGLLNEEAIEKELKNIDIQWGVVAGTVLTKVFKFNDFKEALDFTNKVGKVAEELSHHPDIHLSWGKVETQVTTHSEGGITEKDFELVKKIDQL